MANTFFQFKQFTIQQERAALKVSTDSCLFGAWVAHEIQIRDYQIKNVLDIGAGTGLLMLMIAQQSHAVINGIEIDKSAYGQASENIKASPWHERLHLFLGDVKNFLFDQKYDLILCNPPFYEHDLKSDSATRNLAMHDSGLKLQELIDIADRIISAEGLFTVLLPFHRSNDFIKLAETKDLFLRKRMDVRQTVNHSFFRSIMLFSRKKLQVETFSMAIKDEQNEYTPSFVELLKDYYLYL